MWRAQGHALRNYNIECANYRKPHAKASHKTLDAPISNFGHWQNVTAKACVPSMGQGFRPFLLDKKPLPHRSKVNVRSFPLLDTFDDEILAASAQYGVPPELI